MINELDLVVLKRDLPDEQLAAGDIGTVVLVHQQGTGYEVEFTTLSGDTVAVVTLDASDVRPVAPRRRYPIREIGVFGCYARGEQTEGSDLDIVIDLGDGIGLMGLAALQQDLSDALGLKVDLVMKPSSKRRIGRRILSEAVML